MGNITAGPRLWQEISCTSPGFPVSACSLPLPRSSGWPISAAISAARRSGSSATTAPWWRPAATRCASWSGWWARPRRRAPTHLVTQGAVQSNHVRQTAAVAKRFGMKCTALLEHRIDTNDRDYLNSGNVLLDRLFDTAIEYRPGGTDMNAEAEAKGEALRAAGEKPYVIPGGGSNRVGALGYVSCAQELMQQADEMGLRIDRVVTATGSAGTQAGLVVGLEGSNAGVPVLGIGVRAAEGPAGSQRAPPGGSHRRLCRHARRDRAVGGGRQLRLCRTRIRPPDGGHDRGGADAGAAGGRAARSGVFRQGNGRTDRPDPQGGDPQGRDAWCSCTPAVRSACSATPACSRRRWPISRRTLQCCAARTAS